MIRHSETIVSDWKDLNSLEVEWPDDIFRGQSNFSWDITTSLYRSLNGPLTDGEFSNSEFWMLREFKRKARNYITDVPSDEDTIGWLALMQHYGAPTRLIDFTRSFYVACYFALKGAKEDAAIWCVNQNKLHELAHTTFGIKQGLLRDEWEDDVYTASNAYLANILGTAARASESDDFAELEGVVSVNPIQRNLRLSSQQGLFLMLFDVRESLNSALESIEYVGIPALRKIVLKKNMHVSAIAHLREMNITTETLFPGIDGMAQSLLHRHHCIL